MEPKILYEDEELLVIDKPTGVVVNRAESVKGETVEDWISKNFKFHTPKGSREASFSNFKLLRHGVVHRIDKETSGVLIVAKTPRVFEDLQRQFKERKVEKTYLALVHGRVFPEEGTISAPVGRLPWNRERFGILAGGREAETRYKVISNFKFLASLALRRSGQISNEMGTLLELYPKTGRTHQIRVHLKSIGHPVVGDEFYAGRKTARQDRTWCPRLFLHAQNIAFTHPKSRKRVSVASELPPELRTALAQLQAMK